MSNDDADRLVPSEGDSSQRSQVALHRDLFAGGRVRSRVEAEASRTKQAESRYESVVLRALEREPERRYQHVSELGSEVQSLQGAAPMA